MNHLLEFKSLKNRYFALRHGEATCNVLRILISHIENGVTDFGLTDAGKQQIKEVIENQNLLNGKTIIYSSDFLRTKETAEIAREVLGATSIHLDARLRERYFGDFEKMDYDFYKLVWAKDSEDNTQTEHQVESILAVQDRVTSLVADLEKQYQGQNILLVFWLKCFSFNALIFSLSMLILCLAIILLNNDEICLFCASLDNSDETRK